MNSEEDSKVDVPVALRAYQQIRDHGQREGNGHVWRGVYAESDFDGYNVTLSAEDVTLRISFHSKFTVDCRHTRSLRRFLRTLREIEAAG